VYGRRNHSSSFRRKGRPAQAWNDEQVEHFVRFDERVILYLFKSAWICSTSRREFYMLVIEIAINEQRCCLILSLLIRNFLTGAPGRMYTILT